MTDPSPQEDAATLRAIADNELGGCDRESAYDIASRIEGRERETRAELDHLGHIARRCLIGQAQADMFASLARLRASTTERSESDGE